MIDHILVSNALVGHLREVHVVPQAGHPHLPSITEDPTERRDALASDHSPILARFAI